ncbi:peroxidase family protein [Pseudomonas sp. CR3202]|uniref:peroxidase family protein n=1 Tax=Pseudomonas sp. CR3202 TaxID=3351532 RepID=UPI003BF05080
MPTLIKADLDFILQQIKIAEAHAAGGDLAQLIGNPLLPWGLRTVDGSFNSLLPGQSNYGSADQIMPRLLDPVFLPAENGSSYNQTSGVVTDSQPRTISNLIVDQTISNPAAVQAYVAAGLGTLATGTQMDPGGTAYPIGTLLGLDGLAIPAGQSLVLPNVSADQGITAPFNSWMTLFGQFFDHGLDLVNKGGNGIVFVPLQPDDPLYVPGSPTNFMVLTRATQVAGPGADGILGTADDTTHESVNQTTPFVDQNQTYTSHASHQVFLREYALVNGRPVATGHMLEGANGGLATWADIKLQARTMLGIDLADTDVTNVPLLATDEYGRFERGPNGFAQVVMRTAGADGILGSADDGLTLVEGNPLAPISLSNALRTGHAFLDDIAHAANPTGKTADSDSATGLANADASATTGNYDNELLDAHYITGDGRGNENIGLTAVHHVFHSEHNRLVEHTKDVVLQSADLAFLNEWLLVDVAALPATPAEIDALLWDGERLFQAARFTNEMQYQHLVFEEFARTVQPQVDVFNFQPTIDLDPAIVAEFAHTVYRFGHSMLNDTVARIDSNLQSNDIGLIQAFLNPLEFANGGTADIAAGAIIRGMTRQVGNEIDEFVVGALRNNLVGLPLDLAALNIARGRDTGIPSLNNARAQFFEMTGDAQLKPYASWVDFAMNIKNPASIINFIAAYGTHSSLTAPEVDTLVEKRAAATLLVMGGTGAPADRVDYLNGTGAWTGVETGLNLVDFWIGGLAEEKMPFGGMLGSTFNFVFEVQLEKLQDGDRYYYLSRTQGMNLLNELEANSFSALVMRNTDLGDPTSSHLPGNLFQAVDHILEIETTRQIGADPVGTDPLLEALRPTVVRQDLDGDGDGDLLQYTGGAHVVLGGSAEDDTLIAGDGDDTLWGDAGNDHLEGGYGVDLIHGGAGDDFITDIGNDIGDGDTLHGEEGDDVIHGGNGLDLIFGGSGRDFIIGGVDNKQVFGGTGDDFIHGGEGLDFLMGNEGDDWMEGGARFDTLAGDNSELFFNSPIIGHDVLMGNGGDNDYDAESGDDIMFQGVGIERNEGMFGFDWAIHKGHMQAADSDLAVPIFTTVQADILRDRFDQVEGLSGWQFHDVLIGDDRGRAAEPVPELIFTNHELTQAGADRIAGLQAVLGTAAAANPGNDPNAILFDGGNIILGGDGSDLMEGRGQDDILDGDAWLNARISVRSPLDPTVELFSVDSMVEIQARVLAGEIRPSQLQIVREILIADGSDDVDTAVFSDARQNYQVTQNDDGTWTVAHTAGTQADGTDLLRNIERLQFADQTEVISGSNGLPTGTVLISDTTPARGQVLTATAAFDDPDGVVPGTTDFTWQVRTVDGGWADVGTGATFQPGTAQLGQALRVIASFTDGLGVLERVASAPTAAVIVNNAPVGLPAISDTTPTQGQVLTVSTAAISDPDGLAGVQFSYQWQVGNAGTFTDIAGATGSTFTPAQEQVNQQMRVVVSFTDNVGNPERLISDPTTAVTDVNDAPTGAPTISNSTPAYGQVLTAGRGTIADPDGTTTSTFNYQWRSSSDGGLTFANILGATAATFTPGVQQAGQMLQVVATYTDDAGFSNSVASAATAVLSGIQVGTPGADSLTGTAGDDVLIGGAGADLMVGGLGNDIYEVTEAGDVVVEQDGEGHDTVSTSLASYELGANFEGLFFGGSGDFTGIGNAADNVLVGNAGNDVLNGAGGADVMAGGLGNDTYAVAEAGDLVIEMPGEGADTVLTSLASYVLGANLENLTFVGSGDFTGIGNSLDNVMVGGGGNDILIGNAGADHMTGGLGNDIYEVTEAGDVVLELAGAGHDTVSTSLDSYSLGADVEGLFYGGGGNFTGIGNELDNVIVGGTGQDFLNGGLGNDTMVGGLGNDTFMFAAGFGQDRLFSFDADPAGGQDLLDVTALGITAANFAANVNIQAVAGSTQVSIGADSITLVGVADAGSVTQADFILAG